MKMRSTLAAMLGAGALVLGVAGMAMADAPGNPWNGNGYPSQSCTPTTTGTMLWIFNNGGTPTNLTINGELQTGSWVNEGNGSFHFTATIDGTNYPPTSAVAAYTGDNGQLVLSGCNEGTTTTSSTTTSSSTTSSSTTSSSTTSSSTTTTTTTAGSFTSAQSGATAVPTEPNTATVGGSNSSGPSDSTWLFVAALGILVASLVILTPARAKTRR